MGSGRRVNHCVQVAGSFGTGGNGKLAMNIAGAMADRGVRSTCIAVRSGGSKSVSVPGVDCIDLEAGSSIISKFRAMKRLRRFVISQRPDLIHVHGPQSLQLVLVVVKSLRNRPQLWFTWHDSETVVGSSGLRRLVLCRSIRACDRVFGSSESVVERLDHAIGIPGLASVFVNGVPVGEMTGGHKNPIPSIVWTGRIVPPKDPGILIKVAARLHQEGCRFRLSIVGKAPEHLRWFEDQLHRDAIELGIGDIVDFTGWVADVSDLLRNASIAVQTSRTEGLSMALLEQMMAGLAVVATDVGDTRAALATSDVGMLVAPGDEDAIFTSLRDLLHSSEKRFGMGSAARLIALEKFSTDAVARRVLEIMERSP